MTDDYINHKEIAEKLYLALIQMKQRRGVHIDDIDTVLDALGMWEELNGDR